MSAAAKGTDKRQYWYRLHVGECPVCGRDQGWRERVYGKKPKHLQSRRVLIPYMQLYDYCEL